MLLFSMRIWNTFCLSLQSTNLDILNRVLILQIIKFETGNRVY